MRNRLSGLSSHKVLFLFAGLIFTCTSCEYENAEIISDAKTVSYAFDISPILISKCAVGGCHVESATIGNYNFYPEIKSRIDNGQFKLRVFDLKLMPPLNSAPLSSTELFKLKKWVDQGALNN